MVHGFSNFSNFEQSLGRQMPTAMADFHAPRELLEVALLRSSKRIHSEKRDDHPKEIVSLAHDVTMQVLLVVVVPPVDADSADTKEALYIIQRADTFGALNDYETVGHLISGLVAFSARSARLPNEADGEASLSVYKTNHPASPDQPFLLIFRTVRIVTAHEHILGRVPDGYSGFPAYSRMLTVTLL